MFEDPFDPALGNKFLILSVLIFHILHSVIQIHMFSDLSSKLLSATISKIYSIFLHFEAY